MPPKSAATPSKWVLAHRTKRSKRSTKDFTALYTYIVSNWKKMSRDQLSELSVEAAECLTPAGSPVCKFVSQGIMMSLDAKHDGKNTKDPWIKKTPSKPKTPAPSTRQQVTPPPELSAAAPTSPDDTVDIPQSPAQPSQQLPTPDTTPAKTTGPNPDDAIGDAMMQEEQRVRDTIANTMDGIQTFLEGEEAKLYATPAQDEKKRKEVEGTARRLRSLRKHLSETPTDFDKEE